MSNLSLNPEQNEAVKHVNGPLLVLAGAGSGKTRIVTQRIAHLIDGGISPDQILALTFTNKAAQEMRHRVESLCHHQVLICTFHSLGVQILKESIDQLEGYQKDFSIYDEEDSHKLIKQVLEDLQINNKEIKTKSIKNLISRVKNNLQSPQNFIDEYGHPFLQKHFCQIFSSYQKLLQQNQALDFDDLLYLVVKLFKKTPETLKYYREKWPYVLIDEYQDTNEAQYVMTKMLVQPHHNLFVVGDPDQSIYSWRGANIQNILRFKDDYPEAKEVKLEQNYRSTETILKAANALIENNSQRMEKNLWSQKGSGEPIYFYVARDERDEASFIVNKVLALKNKKQIPLKDMVIFYRTNFQSRVFEDRLLSENIPYKIVGGLSFYQRREIKDVLSYMKLLINPYDLVSFKRSVNLPKRGLGEQSLNKIISYAHRYDLSLPQALTRILQLPFSESQVRLNKKQIEGMQQYLDLLDSLQNIAQENSLQLLIEAIIEKAYFYETLKADKETFADRKANLEEFIAKGAEKDFTEEGCDLKSFLDEISLATSAENEHQDDQISLMTIHNGKGLEFEVSFLIGLEEELFPHINSFDSEASIEEERRLCYVAITRAKKLLYLSASRFRFLWGSQRKMRPSRFLKELPSHYIQRVHLPYESLISPIEKVEEESIDPEVFQVNDLVYHPDFGEGRVQEVSQAEMGTIYEVRFKSDQSIKKLLAQYAPLQAVK